MCYTIHEDHIWTEEIKDNPMKYENIKFGNDNLLNLELHKIVLIFKKCMQN